MTIPATLTLNIGQQVDKPYTGRVELDKTLKLPKTGQSLGQQLLVLDRGFVYYGKNVSISGDMVSVSGAKNIRKWGTTKGLVELINGPLKETVVDDTGDILVPLKAVIHFIKCNWLWRWQWRWLWI